MIHGLWHFQIIHHCRKDIQQHEAADFLAQHGVDMAHSDAEGIDPAYFGELMFSSGLAMNESLKWIAFRGSFDFGFLLKVRLIH